MSEWLSEVEKGSHSNTQMPMTEMGSMRSTISQVRAWVAKRVPVLLVGFPYGSRARSSSPLVKADGKPTSKEWKDY